MIQILLDSQNNIFEAGDVRKGVFPEVDPNVELYKVTNEQGDFYAITTGFKAYQVSELPSEHDYHFYTYTPEEGFVYHEPPKSSEQIQEEISNDVTASLLGMTDIYVTLEEIKEEIKSLKGE